MARSYLLPYQCLEVYRVHRRVRVARYVPTPAFWEDLEFFRGVLVDIPLVVTCLPVRLINDPLSGLWVVFTTEWVTKYSTYLLRDLYDTYCLCYVPPLVREYIFSIDLSFVLCSASNHRVLLDLIDVIDEIDWTEIPLFQARRDTLRWFITSSYCKLRWLRLVRSLHSFHHWLCRFPWCCLFRPAIRRRLSNFLCLCGQRWHFPPLFLASRTHQCCDTDLALFTDDWDSSRDRCFWH